MKVNTQIKTCYT